MSANAAVFYFLLTAALTPLETRQLVERYNQAQVLIEEGRYERATRELGGLINDYGSSEYGDELRYTLAECYFNQGKFSNALNIFLGLLEHPRFSYIRPEAMFGAAVSYLMVGNYRQAQQLLEKLAKEPGYANDPRTSYALGVLYYFQGAYEQAQKNLEGLEMPEAKFYLGKTYARQGKPLAALLKFKEVTDQLPNTPLAQMAHFNAGLALFLNRDYDGARAKFQFFLEQFSSSPLSDFAHYFLGCALAAQNEYAAAIDQLLPLTRASNNFLAAHSNYFVGYCQLALGRAQEAVERFQRVRANYPRTRVSSYANLQLAEAMLATADTVQTLLTTSQLARMFTTGELSGVGHYLSGVIYYQIGDYSNAAEQFERVLSSYAGTALREPAAAMLLMTLNSAREFEKSVALGTKYLADYPNESSEWRARTLFCLAEAFYYSGKYSEADNFYQAAYSHQRGGDVATYARLGRAYTLYHLGRLNEAVEGFKGLLNARLNDTLFTISAYLGYGYCLFNQQEYLKALDVFEALTNTFPDNPLAAVPGYFYAGYCYYQLKYYGQAVDAWTNLMNKFPENNPKVAEAAFRTGDTYFKALEYDKAIAAFNFVIQRYPFSEFAPASQALIAQCYYNRRQYLDAIREYQKFLDLFPSDRQAPGVRKSLEMSYFLAGQEDSSVMNEFLRKFPQSEMAAEGQYARGRELYGQGKFEEAIVELQKTVVNFPNSAVAAEAQLLTAEAYAQLKRWPETVQAYRKFLSYFPEHEQRAGALFNLGIAYFNAGDYKSALETFEAVINSAADSEYAESARKNAEVCRQRLGAGEPATTPVTQPREGER
ncbi:MAG: tetratricopeptide repeat protein [candidate division WOR-3 bacterium]|jgi:TolA-binding protein